MMSVAAFILLFLLAGEVSLLSAASEGGGWGWIETAGRWFNLLFIFALLYYFTRKPLRQFFENRRRGIQEELREARLAREEAERKLAEIEERMAALEEELEQIRAEAQKEAEFERERLREQTEQEIEKILSAARREIEGLTRAARKELRDFVAELALQLAEKRIASEITEEDERKAYERFLSRLSAPAGEQ